MDGEDGSVGWARGRGNRLEGLEGGQDCQWVTDPDGRRWRRGGVIKEGAPQWALGTAGERGEG